MRRTRLTLCRKIGFGTGFVESFPREMVTKHALIGGGTGFIGTRLCQLLSKSGYEVTVVSRMPGIRRLTWHDLDQKGLPASVTAVVNLTGQNVLDPARRWTPGFKQNVWNSRINSASSLVKAISNSKTVQAFVNVSGVSLYKPADKVYTEDDSGEYYDFMSKLCLEWEKSSNLPKDINCRQINIRSGVVIGRGGGMIASIQIPFWLGLGGPIGTGKQPLPWIHILDLCRMIQYSIENTKVSGPLNGVAPEIVTNEQFSKEYASALRRPAIFTVPEFVVDTLFGRERSVLLTTGAKVQPKRVLDFGFEYKYPTVKAACSAVVNKTDK